MCFENLSPSFKLDRTVQEFFSFFKVRVYEKYAQVSECNAKLFHSLSQGDHIWHADMLEVDGWWDGKVGNGLLVPLTYCDDTSYFY